MLLKGIKKHFAYFAILSLRILYQNRVVSLAKLTRFLQLEPCSNVNNVVNSMNNSTPLVTSSVCTAFCISALENNRTQ